MAATTITKWMILSLNMFIILTLTHAHQVPCFFIFGDSQSDNGNNNPLVTKAKANYPPYGIDFPNAIPTGRFTNGRNIPDCIAEYLGFPNSIPPFAATEGPAILNGLNYASGAAGILDNSGRLLGDRVCMNRQLENHKATIAKIAALLGNQTMVDSHLHQSLYVVNIGSNDYINNYYQQPPSPSSSLTPNAFADEVIATFSKQLKSLYDMGSRKVAVFGVGLIGCIPQEILLYPITNGSPCVDNINIAVSIFNAKLVSLINDLNKNLPNAHFTYINVTSIALGGPGPSDVSVVNVPCCEVQKAGEAAPGQCLPNGVVCENRDDYIFFDNFHPTEISYTYTASRAYRAVLQTDASPVDIERLVRL